MIELDIRQIKDYMFCPEMYRLSYVALERPSKNVSTMRLAEYALQKAAYQFFWAAFEGREVSMGQLRQSFGDIFIGRRTKAQTLLMNTSKDYAVTALYEQRSVESITRFYNNFVDNIGTPILINTDYTLQVGDVTIKGLLPVIREYNGEIEMLDIRNDETIFKRSTEGLILNHDIELISAGLAFKQIFQTELKTFKCYMLYTGNTHTIHKKLTDIERFYVTITSVGKAIQNGIYFPSYNYNCINCAYYNKCIVT